MRCLRFASFAVVVSFSSIANADVNADLLAAAKKGDAAAVKKLIADGADVNAKTPYGVTALLQAAGKGHLEIVKILLENKADPNIKDTFYGQSPLASAAEESKIDIIKALLDAGAKDVKGVLRSSASGGKLELVKVILDKAKLEPDDLTAALAATPAKNKEIAELLTKAGAKPTKKAEAAAAVKIDKAILATYVGQYQETENFIDFDVTLKDDELSGKFEGGAVFVLAAIDATNFSRATGNPLKFTFQLTDGKVTGMLLKTSATEMTFKRIEKADTAPKLPPVVEPTDKVTQPKNWPQFRGVAASGIADGQYPPTGWDVEKNEHVRWKTPIPGLGHSCPAIWGDHVFITSAVSDGDTAGLKPGLYGDVDSVKDSSPHAWHVYSVNKTSGKIEWDVVSRTGVPTVKRHLKGTHANPTVATDGKHVVACFGSEGLYCYDADGKLLWQRDLGKLDSGWFFDADYQWGFGSSPIIFEDLCIIQCDVGKGSFIAAYRLADGQDVWRTERDEIPSWGTPTIIKGPDRLELVTNATKFARGYDPRTGAELWRLGNNAEITVPTPIFGHGLIYITSGYRPIQPIYAVRPGATGDITLKEKATTNDSIAWSQSKKGPYMPTPIIYGDYFYTCANDGIVTCYDAKTGKQQYRERIGGAGGYTASPIAADGRLYFTSEEGGTRVVKAGAKYELLSINPLGDICMATPAIADGCFFVRTQKWLIALGQ
jgi:outer membrane protein assembly factor BamB